MWKGHTILARSSGLEPRYGLYFIYILYGPEGGQKGTEAASSGFEPRCRLYKFQHFMPNRQ